MPEFRNKVRLEDVFVLAETTKALLVDIDGEEHWIPTSQIDDDSEVYKKGQEGQLVISDWIAGEKGIV